MRIFIFFLCLTYIYFKIIFGSIEDWYDGQKKVCTVFYFWQTNKTDKRCMLYTSLLSWLKPQNEPVQALGCPISNCCENLGYKGVQYDIWIISNFEILIGEIQKNTIMLWNISNEP
jgi:hypothetical protein